MAGIAFTPALEKEYERLFRSCVIRSERFAAVDAVVEGALAARARYAAVGNALKIPWYFIAAIHNMESSQRFTGHLHNGDPLSARTVNVPAGRPPGKPPFTWEQSAEDALRLHDLHKVTKWSLGRLLYEMERYNGWGYRLHHPEVLSPYLWSFSQHYTRGKYVADGRWSDTAVSGQCGAAVILRRLEERGAIALAAPPAEPLYRYSTGHVAGAEALQGFLNTLPGIHLRVDGVPADKTSMAVKQVFGFYLMGDPRA